MRESNPHFHSFTARRLPLDQLNKMADGQRCNKATGRHHENRRVSEVPLIAITFIHIACE